MQYGPQHHVDVTAQAAGAVIYDDQHRILLVRERHPAKAGFWHIASGRLERDEFPEQAARREVFEETGLTVQFESYLNTYVGQFDDGALVLRHVWIAPLPAGQTPQPHLTDEITEARFFALADIDRLYADGALRMHHTWLIAQDAQTWLARRA